MTKILVDLGVSFVLLMVLFGWIGVIWLWAGEFKDMWRHGGLGKIHGKRATRR